MYSGEYAGRSFQLRIDYGGRSDQLRYGLSFDDVPTGIRARRLSYEGLIGLGDGHWDFVTADNLSESVLLLAKLVQELVVIPVCTRAGSENTRRGNRQSNYGRWAVIPRADISAVNKKSKRMARGTTRCVCDQGYMMFSRKRYRSSRRRGNLSESTSPARAQLTLC